MCAFIPAIKATKQENKTNIHNFCNISTRQLLLLAENCAFLWHEIPPADTRNNWFEAVHIVDAKTRVHSSMLK